MISHQPADPHEENR